MVAIPGPIVNQVDNNVTVQWLNHVVDAFQLSAPINLPAGHEKVAGDAEASRHHPRGNCFRDLCGRTSRLIFFFPLVLSTR